MKVQSTLNEALADVNIGGIGLENRTVNKLEKKGIFNLLDLLQSKREELLSIKNFGDKMLEEVLLLSSKKLAEVKAELQRQEDESRQAMQAMLKNKDTQGNGSSAKATEESVEGLTSRPGSDARIADLRARFEAEADSLHAPDDNKIDISKIE